MIKALLPSRPRRGVNLTPLIDVVFILLMFFMLTSTFSQWRSIELLTPVASQSAMAQSPQIVMLGEDGSLSFRGIEIFVAHYNELGNANLDALSNDEPLLIVPASDATVQDMISTLEKLQALGFSKTTLGRAASP
jgi:biopolymer transport protein ExbD